jgi:transposase
MDEQSMCLHPTDRDEIPADTAALGQKLLDRDNAYRLIGERLPDLIRDEDFGHLFSPIGGPAISPAVLALVTVFQMMEKLPDRLAAAAVALRIDWKYALHLPLGDAGFHFTNLSHFRQRLLEHQAQALVFERLLQKLLALGFIRQRGKQRTDSSYVLGLVAKLSRLELIWETLRVSLKAIQMQDERWLERVVPEAFLQRYLVKRSDYNLTAQQAAEQLRQAGADGLWWLQQLESAPAGWREWSEIQTLRTVWEQQFEWDEQSHYRGPRSQLEAHGLIQSPHEPEVRYRQKRGKPWQGYTAQVTETAEAKHDPNFITDVSLTDAQTDDKEALPDIQDRLVGRDLPPAQQIVDQNYVSGTQLAQSQERGIELVGPIATQPGPVGFKLDDFRIDLAKEQAICPAGNVALKVSLYQRSDGSNEYQFFFGPQCAACALRPQCTTAQGGRTLQYHEHHPLVSRRRDEMKSESFRQLMKLRPPIEGTLSQLMRLGMRHARYRGLHRTNLQLLFSAVAINLRRLCRLWAADKQPSWAS